ncbi:uncharacterized protein CMU_035130 [Cryptosporidium muris RN66]|uniref:Uncharacterized protein n=1 Tax=Cryptosporidium muris (strain RN66) TaxID=441375 RepID=B6AFY6_CRYMR|nr:uncharacterized protein CMU_035130 [Cryptosporidium muris RN66]EEA07127.1 hypothetical protein, conserved [Cryptosporidium muris RN66]|eukprot:XP_002141476.1 hypothetical protein [Cryptosporidium muris RN66]
MKCCKKSKNIKDPNPNNIYPPPLVINKSLDISSIIDDGRFLNYKNTNLQDDYPNSKNSSSKISIDNLDNLTHNNNEDISVSTEETSSNINYSDNNSVILDFEQKPVGYLSNTTKQDSLILKSLKESNNTIKESNNTIKESNNTIKYSNNIIKESNNTIKKSNITKILSNKSKEKRNILKPIIFKSSSFRKLIKNILVFIRGKSSSKNIEQNEISSVIIKTQTSKDNFIEATITKKSSIEKDNEINTKSIEIPKIIENYLNKKLSYNIQPNNYNSNSLYNQEDLRVALTYDMQLLTYEQGPYPIPNMPYNQELYSEQYFNEICKVIEPNCSNFIPCISLSSK